jgi:predicted DNA-binding transcriptional regulator AlpA
MMAKQLLTTRQTMQRLGVSPATFYRIRAKLMARGLKHTKIGKRTKYLESSLDKVIERAINAGRPIA